MIETIKLFHRTGVRLVPGGYCGPDTGVHVVATMAEAWLRDNPRDWSREPFVKEPEPEERPRRRRKTEDSDE